MTIAIRQASVTDTTIVSNILLEAAAWLEERAMPMWRDDELSAERIATEIADGLYFVAEIENEVAGTVRYQLSDSIFWPDTPGDDAAYVHRLAVRRRYAGGEISTALLRWAVERTASLGRRFVRLDCEAERAPLRDFYERFGFNYHSERQVGPYYVARYEYAVDDGKKKP
jgi:ribosomal protein S18 acetylase RimI-like enzyme